ncbi:retrotransposon protein, putative, ty1-copia subclass [Tanacetum coccineum]
MGYYFYFPPENKVIVARYGDFLERDLISQEFSGRDYDLEDDHMDTLPSENTSEIPVEPESWGVLKDDEVGAMDEEMKSMKVNKVWIVIDRPPNAKVVRSKWIFKKKTDMDGKVHTYKARLVAKGCTQTYGIDYEETFSPNRDEPCVYRKASGSDVVFLILYVDDILIMGNNIPRLKEVKDYLGKCFSVKDLGEAAYILGIKIYRDRSLRLIGLNQSAYIDKILKKFSMQNSKKGFIPMEVKHDLSNEMCTRPDVAFAQNLVSRYQQNPGKLHWVAVKHILKYLRNTKDMFLVYGGNPDTELDVTGFCDASCKLDKMSEVQTGFCLYRQWRSSYWMSKKAGNHLQCNATQLSTWLVEAAMEAIWIRKFVGVLDDAFNK